MKIQVNFYCPDLTDGIKNGVYHVCDGGTIEDLLEACETACNVKLSDEARRIMLFSIEGRNTSKNTALSDGQKVSVLRVVSGG